MAQSVTHPHGIDSTKGMILEMVVVQADYEPIKGIANPGPHQSYRNSRITIQQRELSSLHPNDIRIRMLYAGVCGTDIHLVIIPNGNANTFTK